MESLTRRSFISSRGLAYSYIYRPALPGRSTLLFLHGFPSHLDDWAHQIRHFGSRGYGVIAPDLLGFGGSDKPDDVTQYNFKPMSQDLAELLESLQLASVVGIGHDLGANLLGRLAMYQPSKITSLVFLAVGSGKPGGKFDVEAILQMTKQALGHELFGYIPWLGGDEDPHRTLEQHAESVMSLMFTNDPNGWNKWFHPLGEMKRFVLEDTLLDVAPWFTQDLQRRHLESFGALDGYKGATRWYKMLLDNTSIADEANFYSFKIQQPALFIGDAGSSGQQEQMLSEWVPNLGVNHISSGHWVQLEKPQEIHVSIENFLDTLQY